MNPELKVGFFAIGVLLVLSYMTFKVGSLRLTGDEGYALTVLLDDSAGIDLNTKVKVAGVDAGRVDSIALVGGRAQITLAMDPGVRLHDDAEIALRSLGFLGDKYLAISSGSADRPLLQKGGVIRNVRHTVAFDQLATRLNTAADSLSSLAGSLEKTFGDREMQSVLRETLENVRALSSELRAALDRQDTKLHGVLDEIQNLTVALRNVVDETRGPIGRTAENLAAATDLLRTRGPALIDTLNETADSIRTVARDAREPFISGVEELRAAAGTMRETADSLKNVTARVERGEGTLGKLITDERLYEDTAEAVRGVKDTLNRLNRFRTFVELKGEYLEQSDDGKGYFTITLKPREDKYYLLGVVSDPEGRSRTKQTVTTSDGIVSTVSEETVESEIEFTFQFARRFADLALRIGVTESTLGLGADYFFFDDRLKLSADVWDFGTDEPGADEAHLKIGLDYTPLQYMFVWGGYDNVMNTDRRGYFLGGGIRFEDEDLKYLFGTAGGLFR